MVSGQKKQRKYICGNCGATAGNSFSLCNPLSDHIKKKFCGANPLDVCTEKEAAMKYRCFACGSVSEDPDLLCDPVK